MKSTAPVMQSHPWSHTHHHCSEASKLPPVSTQKKISITLLGVLQPTLCNVSATREIARASSWQHPPLKNKATSKSPVGDISVVTLIRTDTTLDHSQKAEKVCTYSLLP